MSQYISWNSPLSLANSTTVQCASQWKMRIFLIGVRLDLLGDRKFYWLNDLI